MSPLSSVSLLTCARMRGNALYRQGKSGSGLSGPTNCVLSSALDSLVFDIGHLCKRYPLRGSNLQVFVCSC